jgi:hypothetical protein
MPEPLALLQKQFAAHIRSPSDKPAPADVEERRMDVYRKLFFNNLRSLLSWNFPVLRKLHSDEDWSNLVRAFYVEHRARTPLFPELPREFLQYLQDQRQHRPGDPPFLLELAHYEWVEMALSLDERELAEVPADPAGDLLTGVPVLSPLAWPLSYQYPVHRIGPSFQPEEPPAEATHLLVYRRRDDQVKFMQLNPVSALLLQLLQENEEHTGQHLLNGIVQQLAHPKPEVVIEGGTRLLADLLARDVLLGTRPQTAS